ncbi:MAG: DNA polymerase IV [Candidatus Staskawiczbacteria bacterium]|jgi:DNA polymerase IV (DinB-like DNA polymerase)
MPKRIIAHLDMDAFFASVEEAATPAFLDKPIVVGSEIINGRGRGVVSTANYKARAYGIHSALPITIAWRLSEKAKSEGKPPAIFLPVDFELYNKVSNHIHEIIKKHSKLVEQASIDEFYFDLSFAKSFKKAKSICEKIKKEIKNTEKITCSVGIAPNKLISKIAAGINKPNGMLLIEEKNVHKFLNPLPIREVPGIGPKTAGLLYIEDIQTIKDLSALSMKKLTELLGNKHGESIYYKSRGIDNDPITEFHEVKSIGEQTTFSQNTLEAKIICDNFLLLCDNVFKRFQESNFTKFKTITITIRFADFQTQTSSKSFKESFTKNKTLFAGRGKKQFELEILKLVLPFLDRRQNPRQKPIRLIGVRVEKLS